MLFATTGSKIPPNGFLVECCEPVKTVHSDWLVAETNMFNAYANKLDDFDIICGMNWFGMEYRAKAVNPKLKVCHTHHGGLNLEWWGKEKAPFKLNLIAISQWMKKVYASQGFESRVCYNGINLGLYPYNAVHGARLLWIGRVDSFKKPDLAIRVAKRAQMGLDIIGGTFVQDPAYLEQIRAQCDGKQIRFYPDVPHERKVNLLQHCLAVLFTSKMGEPFGLVPIEAFACGAPVISTIDGATPETINEDVGFLCKDEDEMVHAVRELCTIKPERCRQWAEKFSHIEMTKAYLQRFAEILSHDEW